jgi:dephospho-CoA kinase
MMTVALTGSVGSGKSTVAAIWQEAGIGVLNADAVAREVVQPGTPGLGAVVDSFGRDILDETGALDRDAMRRVVFEDPDARARLESILHPLIRARRDEWVEAMRKEGAVLVVAEVPLLFEVGLETEFDSSVLVTATRDVCLDRLSDSRGLSREEGLKIWSAQMEPAQKEGRADYVIHNNGTLADLRDRALALLDLLLARSRSTGGV